MSKKGLAIVCSYVNVSRLHGQTVYSKPRSSDPFYTVPYIKWVTILPGHIVYKII